MKFYDSEAFRRIGTLISVLGFLFILSLTGNLFSPSDLPDLKKKEHTIPLTSFVKIETVIDLTVTECEESANEEVDCVSRTERERPNMASGVVIDENRIITAGHVCMSMVTTGTQVKLFELLELNGDGKPKGSITLSTEAIDFHGKRHAVEILTMSPISDLCVLSAPTISVDAVPIASQMPTQGSRIYNIAAPHGMFAPGMSLIFEGYYAGDDWDGDTWFTFPAAPGSSGSPIFNENGELIGIVTMASEEFEHIAIGSDVKRVRKLLSADQSG